MQAPPASPLQSRWRRDLSILTGSCQRLGDEQKGTPWARRQVSMSPSAHNPFGQEDQPPGHWEQRVVHTGVPCFLTTLLPRPGWEIKIVLLISDFKSHVNRDSVLPTQGGVSFTGSKFPRFSFRPSCSS